MRYRSEERLMTVRSREIYIFSVTTSNIVAAMIGSSNGQVQDVYVTMFRTRFMLVFEEVRSTT